MGWCSGVSVAESVWDLFDEFIPADKKGFLALRLVDVFESYDCDCMEEADFVQEYLKYEDGWEEK